MIAISKRPLCWLIALGVLAGSFGLPEGASAAPNNVASELKTLDREVAELNAALKKKKKKKHHHHKHHRHHHHKKHAKATTQSVSKTASPAKAPAKVQNHKKHRR